MVGKQKPEPIMFETAYEKLNLTDSDKNRIVMIGNNLKKDKGVVAKEMQQPLFL